MVLQLKFDNLYLLKDLQYKYGHSEGFQEALLTILTVRSFLSSMKSSLNLKIKKLFKNILISSNDFLWFQRCDICMSDVIFRFLLIKDIKYY